MTGHNRLVGAALALVLSVWLVAFQPAAGGAGSGGWSLLKSGTSSKLNAIACPTSNTCYAAGAGSTVLRTSNGGKTWIRLRSSVFGASTDVTSAACPGPNTCTLVSPPSTVFRTADGGRSWRRHLIPLSKAISGLGPLACSTRTTCFAVAYPARLFADTPAIYVTRNDGGSWSRESIPSTVPCQGDCITTHYRLEWISCPTSRSCLAGGMDFIDSHQGYAVALLSTDDQGHTWKLRHSPMAPILASCPGSATCYGLYSQPGTPADQGPAFVSTRDMGKTWHTTHIGRVLAAVACPSLTICEAAGAKGTLLATANGNHTVTNQSSPTKKDLNAIACPGVNRCYAVGDSGVILALTHTAGR